MRLTQLTDYALRVLIHLAQQPQRLCTIAEIAAHYGVSEPHLMKVAHQLGRAGWIVATRGRGGGLRLARPPREIRLGEVVRSMEPDFFIVECFSGASVCTLTGSCGLTGVMDGALRSFIAHLDAHTLADIVPPPEPAAQVIGLPARWRKAA